MQSNGLDNAPAIREDCDHTDANMVERGLQISCIAQTMAAHEEWRDQLFRVRGIAGISNADVGALA